MPSVLLIVDKFPGRNSSVNISIQRSFVAVFRILSRHAISFYGRRKYRVAKLNCTKTVFLSKLSKFKNGDVCRARLTMRSLQDSRMTSFFVVNYTANFQREHSERGAA